MSQGQSTDQPHKLVAIATCAQVAGVEKEDLRVIEALNRRGIAAVHAVWNDLSVDWSSFGLVVIRSTWDYPECRDEFLAWASGLRRVLNPFDVLRWNTDKRYLSELARAGLPIIPTQFIEPDDVVEPPSTPFVVKPAVSCGAKDTARYDANDLAQARVHVRRLQACGRTVMVQPYLADIEAQGEVALIFIGGTYSHSICRNALLAKSGLRESGAAISMTIHSHEATPIERSLAEQVMLHVPSGLLYGRVDLIPGPSGEPMILEVELTEPSLFLEFSRTGLDRLAESIAHAVN